MDGKGGGGEKYPESNVAEPHYRLQVRIASCYTLDLEQLWFHLMFLSTFFSYHFYPVT